MQTAFSHISFSPAIGEIKVGVVIPCYNEEQRLDRQAFLEFAYNNPQIFLLFVNDGSRDGTERVLRELSAQSPKNMEVLSLPQNGGKAEAVRRGILYLSQTRQGMMKYVGYFDADLATPLEEIPYMLEVAGLHGEPKMIFGVRLVRGGAMVERKWMRHYVSRIFVTLREFFFPFRIYDSQCGAKLIEASIAPKLFGDPFVSKWLFDVELLVRIRRLVPIEERWRAVLEIPLRTWVEVGESKVTLKNVLLQPFELARMAWHYHSEQRK